MPSLAERLGHPADTKLLIVACDNLGFTRSANVGVYESLRHASATTASLMVAAPWARDAAADYRGEDVGVELTLNAEWETYRWGPITHSPSLLDGNGGFPSTREDIWDHADLDEVRKECRAQIERAVFWGFDVSHLGTHLGALQLRAEFFDVYLELAVDFALPMQLPAGDAERIAGFPLRRLAGEEGVIFADRVVTATGAARPMIEEALRDLDPGVTEVRVRPAVDTEELRAACSDWPARVDDHAYLCGDTAFQDSVERAGAVLTDYRTLRELQRSQ